MPKYQATLTCNGKCNRQIVSFPHHGKFGTYKQVMSMFYNTLLKEDHKCPRCESILSVEIKKEN